MKRDWLVKQHLHFQSNTITVHIVGVYLRYIASRGQKSEPLKTGAQENNGVTQSNQSDFLYCSFYCTGEMKAGIRLVDMDSGYPLLQFLYIVPASVCSRGGSNTTNPV